MHMGNELMTPVAAAAFGVVAVAGVGYSARKAQKELSEQNVPLMGVMGAFVFAAQMINFTVLPGVSGHLAGGVLLAILLGPHAAALTMTSILIVQCLIFQDGGILALGPNVINMALVPCYGGYALYSLLGGTRRSGPPRNSAIFTGALVAVLAGAALVPVEVLLAGAYRVPFHIFFLFMIGIHCVIGVAEGAITVAVIRYIRAIRPAALKVAELRAAPRVGNMFLSSSLLVAALAISSFLAFYASHLPDGLEWTLSEKLQHLTQDAEGSLEEHETAMGLPAVLPDYNILAGTLRNNHPRLSKGLAGAIGTVLTLLVVFVVAHFLRRYRFPQKTD